MKIAILDDYQNVIKDLDCFKSLSGHDVTVLTETYTEQELISRLQNIEALVLIRERTTITEQILRALPKLKVISQTGKVSQHIDVSLCQRYGVVVLEGIGSPIAPAELCWALLMAATRHIPAYVSNLKQGQWQQSGELGLGKTLSGRTLGIWGYGRIGQRVAKYASAFDMPVLVWGSESSRKLATSHGFDVAPTKQAFFSNADIVSLHLRLTQETKAIVTASDLALMKSDSLLLNISRAELIEPNALYNVLVKSPYRQAAIDVFDFEPANTQIEPLLQLPNVTATPHLGYVEKIVTSSI